MKGVDVDAGAYQATKRRIARHEMQGPDCDGYSTRKREVSYVVAKESKGDLHVLIDSTKGVCWRHRRSIEDTIWSQQAGP